jgi:glycosyltransferase involved in cell wall biosynthesis
MSKTILFVDEDSQRTGSTISLEYLVKGFKSAGFTVYVLTTKRENKYRAVLEKDAILINPKKWKITNFGLNLYFTNSVSSFSLRGMWALCKEAIKLILGIVIVWKATKESKADFIYSNEYVVVQAYIAAKLLGIPSAVHIRSPFLKGQFGIRRALLARLLPICNDAIFAITRVEAEQIHKRKKDIGKVRVIGEFFPAIEPTLYHESVCRSKFGLSKNKKVISMLGGILDIKGSFDFLTAACHVVEKREDVVFVVAGKIFQNETEERRIYYEQCMKLAAELERKRAVKILGDISNPYELIAASDIIVSPSTQTHFSRPVIEAWGFCKPVIATKTNHMNDLITNGVNGLLVDIGDDKALANVVIQLLNNGDLCSRIGREGKNRTNREFDFETNVRTIVEICKSHINKKVPSKKKEQST